MGLPRRLCLLAKTEERGGLGARRRWIASVAGAVDHGIAASLCSSNTFGGVRAMPSAKDGETGG